MAFYWLSEAEECRVGENRLPCTCTPGEGQDSHGEMDSHLLCKKAKLSEGKWPHKQCLDTRDICIFRNSLGVCVCMCTCGLSSLSSSFYWILFTNLPGKMEALRT